MKKLSFILILLAGIVGAYASIPLTKSGGPRTIRQLTLDASHKNSRPSSGVSRPHIIYLAPSSTDSQGDVMYYEASMTDGSGEEIKWSTTFIFNEADKTVKIENLMEPILANYDYESLTVTGRIEGNRIIFDTPSAYKEEGALVIGQNEWGDYVSLLGGTLVNNPDGSQGVNVETTISLNMTEDKSEIGTDKVLVLYEFSGDYGEGILEDFRYGLKWTKLSDDAISNINVSEIDFGSIYYNGSLTKSVKLSSMGAVPVRYNVSVGDGAHFFTDATDGYCYFGKPVEIPVVFTPGGEGEFTSTLTIEAADQTYNIALKGSGKAPTRDFSALISSEDKAFFTKWENESLGPWELEEDAAFNRNTEKTGKDAILKGFYNSEKPKHISFDYNVLATGLDSLLIYVDNARVKSYAGKASGTCGFFVPEGEHSISWIFRKAVKSPVKDFVTFSNIQLTDATEHDGLFPDGRVEITGKNGWCQYGNWLRPVAANSYIEVSVDCSASESCLDIDVEATEQSPILIFVDNNAYKTVSSKSACPIDINGTGKHTVRFDFSGSNNQEENRLEELTGITNMRLYDEHFSSVNTQYILIGDSCFDTESEYTPENGVVGVNCAVDAVYTNTGRFTLKNLFPINGLFYNPVEGTIKDGKIIFNTIANTNEGSYIAYNDETSDFSGYLGDRWWLTAGAINGNAKMADYDLSETMDVNIEGDMETLRPTAGFGIWHTYRYNNKGMTEFLKKGARFEKVTNSPAILTSTSSLDFGKSFIGTGTVTKKVVVVNKSTKQTECAIEIKGSKDFSATPNTFDLEPLKSKTIEVAYTPTAFGDINASMMVYSDGNDCEISLSGYADHKPDYSKLVTAGIETVREWNTSVDYPWLMDGEEAYSTNTGHNNTVSELTMTFEVPEGKLARFSFDADLAVECEGDFFHVIMDKKDIVYMDQNKRNLVGTEIVGSGSHKVSFSHEKDGITLLPSDDVTKIRNIAIELYDEGEAVAMTHAPRYHYDMVVPIDKGDQTYVWVINKGTSSFKFSGADVEKPFKIECPTTPVAPGDTIAVPVFITPAAPGHYTGNINLHSTAGDIKCTIDARADYVRYLGSFDGATINFPVCSYYANYNQWPIYTQSLYDAKELEGLEGATFKEITYLTVFEGDIDFTATDVNYRIGETGESEINDGHPDYLTTIYEGEQVDVINFEQTIPFKEPYVYKGGNLLLSHDLNSKEGFTIQVYYYCGLEGSGNSCVYLPEFSSFGLMKNNSVPAVRIKYDPSGQDGVDDVETSKEIDSVQYFDLMGIPVENPGNGIYLVVTKFTDGTKSTTKKVFK